MDQRLKHETRNSETAGGKPRQCLRDVGVGKDFLNRISFAQELKAPTDKWGFTKLKSICTTEATISFWKMLPIVCGEWERIFPSYTCDRGFISRIHKELKNTESEK